MKHTALLLLLCACGDVTGPEEDPCAKAEWQELRTETGQLVGEYKVCGDIKVVNSLNT